ncbi:MAG TPA: phage tail protein [Burkholderiaceae bacterium]|nr:phage tail protein [Burkholderiaceae bacterium]
MATVRDRPYAQFNFLVDIGTGETDGPQAGFHEVVGLASSVDVIEYRNGNDKTNSPIKLTGLNRVSDVTLRRGLIGALNLYQWFNEIRNGSPNALRTVTISLQNEEHSATVLTWKLLRARIVRHQGGPLNAGGQQVAIEEIVLACERIEME